MADRISIIIPIYNRGEMLQRLLGSFSRLQCHCPLEFIIVDDCSDEGILAIVETWKDTTGIADVIYHRLSARSGPARARNAGIALSTGNILAFTDSDCVADPRWVELLYRRLNSRPDYAAVGGRVLPLHDDIYSTYNTIFGCLEPPRHIEAVIGANCMFWKQPVIEAGMFDDYFSRPGGEEIGLCMKLWIKGYRFGFEEQAIVYHDYRENLWDFIRTFYHYGIGEKIIFTHRPKEYFRYMQYPEKMHNYIAFKKNLKFQLFFLVHFAYGIVSQRSFLATIPVTRKKRLILHGLYAVHQFCYHLGRQTFFGILVRTVHACLASHPEYLFSLDPGIDRNVPLLEIVDDTIPPKMKPGERKTVSITIKNPSPDLWLSGGFVITLAGAGSAVPFYCSPQQPEMLFFPGTPLKYYFSLEAPRQERDHTFQVYLSSPAGIPLSTKRDLTITVSPESLVMDAEIAGSAFPEALTSGQQVSVSVTMKNTGSGPWNNDMKVWLCAEGVSAGAAALFGHYRIGLPSGNHVIPGSHARFFFPITAPHMPGEYLVRYRMGGKYNLSFGEVVERKITVIP